MQPCTPYENSHICSSTSPPPHSMPFFQIFFALFSHYLRNRLGKFIQCSNEGETKKNRNTETHTSSGMKRKRPSSSMLTISSKTNMHFIDTVTIFERMNEIWQIIIINETYSNWNWKTNVCGMVKLNEKILLFFFWFQVFPRYHPPPPTSDTRTCAHRRRLVVSRTFTHAGSVHCECQTNFDLNAHLFELKKKGKKWNKILLNIKCEDFVIYMYVNDASDTRLSCDVRRLLLNMHLGIYSSSER